MTLAERYSGTATGELLKVNQKKSVFPVTEDCLADHHNSWAYQCRNAEGHFSESDWSATAITPHCIKIDSEYSEYTVSRCGGDGLSHYVGIYGDPHWREEWLSTFKRRTDKSMKGESTEDIAKRMIFGNGEGDDFEDLYGGSVKNLGSQECFQKCGRKQGKCDWCGSGGYCCRKGHHDKSGGCDGIMGIAGKGHVCVAHTFATELGEDETFPKHRVKSAKECKGYCLMSKDCQVFTYYATDMSGEQEMGRCFLYSDAEDCSPGKVPVEHMPYATAGYSKKYSC